MDAPASGFVQHVANLIGDAFEPREFRLANPEREELGTIPDDELFAHYLRNAAADRLNPSRSFDEAGYRRRNPDVDRAVEAGDFLSGYHHYLEHGRAEGRQAIDLIRFIKPDIDQVVEGDPAEVIRRCFDPDLYKQQALDVFGVHLPRERAAEHFIAHGMEYGLVPAKNYDEEFYLAYYADIRAAVEGGRLPSGFAHYVMSGAAEGRLPEYRLGELLQAKLGGLSQPVGIARLPQLEGRLAGIAITVDETREPVLNVLVPSLDPDIMFGGYIAFLNFLCRLRETGRAMRLVVVEDGQSNREWFLRGIAGRPRWLEAFRDVPFFNVAHDGDLPCSPRDRCLAYSAWTAHAAASVAKKLDDPVIGFFIQEYEPVFHENDSPRFLVEASYRLPHVAVFNTAILTDYFRDQRLGVFGDGGSGAFLSFEHALSQVRPPAARELAGRRTRRLIFYARPEQHAARNLFEVGMIALNEAIRRNVFGPEWEFYGIGTLGNEYRLELADGREMLIESRIPQAEYEARLQGFDVGLSLMWAPHPSILPFELANAGVVTVTNEYRSRDLTTLARFGHNLVGCRASIDGIVDGLAEAVRRSADAEARSAGALDWPTDWDRVFDAAFLQRFDAMLPA